MWSCSFHVLGWMHSRHSSGEHLRHVFSVGPGNTNSRRSSKILGPLVIRRLTRSATALDMIGTPGVMDSRGLPHRRFTPQKYSEPLSRDSTICWRSSGARNPARSFLSSGTRGNGSMRSMCGPNKGWALISLIDASIILKCSMLGSNDDGGRSPRPGASMSFFVGIAFFEGGMVGDTRLSSLPQESLCT